MEIGDGRLKRGMETENQTEDGDEEFRWRMEDGGQQGAEDTPLRATRARGVCVYIYIYIYVCSMQVPAPHALAHAESRTQPLTHQVLLTPFSHTLHQPCTPKGRSPPGERLPLRSKTIPLRPRLTHRRPP